MDFDKSNLSSHAQAVQHGLALANRRMMETAAAMDRTLIVGHLDGTFEELPARQVLSQSKESAWWQTHFDAPAP